MLITWGLGFCLLLFGLLKFFKVLRVDSRIEVHGMDVMKHGEPAYPAESWEEQQYWDHQVHRLFHLLSATTDVCDKVMDSTTTIDIGSNESIGTTAMPPQMNFAHLVLTDHFQKCLLSLDSKSTHWNYIKK